MERSITLTDKGINIIGEWTVGEVLAAAQALANNVNAIKIGTTPPAPQPEEPPAQ